MTRTRRAITLLTLWLAMLFAGPVVPAFASSCASLPAVSAPADCPMAHETVKPVTSKTARMCCCCPSESQSLTRHGAALDSSVTAKACDCSVRSGTPVTSPQTLQAPLPGFSVALLDVLIIVTIPPMAHLAADAPLPPFAARLQIPQRARDAGRAPPAL